jgi:septal ring factor EnvC (AmiA/AmiB activator)
MSPWLPLLLAASAAAKAPGAAAQVQSQLAKERAAAAQLAGSEPTLLGKLAEVERQVDVEARAVRAAEGRLRTASIRFSAADVKARAADDELAKATSAATPRLIARYRLGREGYLRFLLGAQSISDLLRRRRLFDALLESDLDALAQLHFVSVGARAARDELAQVRDELSQAATAEAEKRAALESRASQQRRLLAAVQEDKALHDQSVRELEEAARSLSGELGKLQKAPLPAAVTASLEEPLRKLRGKLPFPVEAGRIETRFGRSVDRHFGTVSIQRGIDVRCEEGLPVRAIHGGKVAHAGWFHGYGNLLIIDHGDGYFSLMAHLATLVRAKDDVIRRGDVVGTVGDTGSLKGTYLYFELRKGQQPLDPERWLQKPRKPPPALLVGKGPAR